MTAETPTVETRPVGPEDEQFLLALFRSVRGGALAATALPEPMVAALLRAQYAGQRMSYRDHHPGVEHQLLLVDGRAAGAAWVSREGDRIQVVDIAIDPELQGRGAGTVWLRARQAEARAARLPLTLEVAIDNPGARRLYERLGFVVSGGTPTHVAMRWTP